MNYKKILLKYFPDHKCTGKEFIVDCIFCGDSDDERGNLNINLNTGLWHCWFCDQSGNFRHLLAELDPLFYDRIIESYKKYAKYIIGAGSLKQYIEKKLFQQDERSKTIRESRVLKIKALPIKTHSRAMVYLHHRGITEKMIVKYKLRYCREDDFAFMIIIPFFENDKPVYFIGRSFLNKKMKVRNPKKGETIKGKTEVLYNYDFLKEGGDCCIVEGWADALVVNEIMPTVALCGKSLSAEQIKLLKKKNIKHVYLFFDSDAKMEMFKVAEVLKKYDFKVSITCVEKGDPNDIGVSECARLLKQSKEMNFRNTIANKLCFN